MIFALEPLLILLQKPEFHILILKSHIFIIYIYVHTQSQITYNHNKHRYNYI
jgi:hypothetical protein